MIIPIATHTNYPRQAYKKPRQRAVYEEGTDSEDFWHAGLAIKL
jgi:hypothetical protein